MRCGQIDFPEGAGSVSGGGVMLQKFVDRNVVEVDALIEKAREQLAEQEAKLETHSDAQDVVVRMRQGLARLQVYRSFIEKMN